MYSKNEKMRCGVCGKFLSPTRGVACSICFTNRHRTCLAISDKTQVTKNSVCPNCKRHMRKRENSQTPKKFMNAASVGPAKAVGGNAAYATASATSTGSTGTESAMQIDQEKAKCISEMRDFRGEITLLQESFAVFTEIFDKFKKQLDAEGEESKMTMFKRSISGLKQKLNSLGTKYLNKCFTQYIRQILHRVRKECRQLQRHCTWTKRRLILAELSDDGTKRGDMDNKKKEILRLHRDAIVKDLDVEYIFDEFFSKSGIDTTVLDTIFDNSLTRSTRARLLIDILIQYGSNASFEAFVDCLAKDYNWLWRALAMDTNEPMLNESFENSLSRGDVPRLPKHYVKRAVENEVARKLNTLSRHKILALHGMSGSGKTSIVISVLRSDSELITNKFNGCVFWLNLNNCKTEDDIVAQQNILYRKALPIYSPNSYMNSTMSMSSSGSNFDNKSLSCCEWTIQELKDRLKSQFSEPVLKDALLVLDEVSLELCVEAFDIGCKLLITTRDTGVVSKNKFEPDIIEIENSLTEEESLRVFASYLDIEVSRLPKQAKRFHEACKGSPFDVALIGVHLAENREGFLHNKSLWNEYLKKFVKKEFWIFTKPEENPMKTIEVCINESLDQNIFKLFKKLAVFPYSVKVSPKVVSRLWDMKEVHQVIQIMKKLKDKSLIIETYDVEQKSYFYELTDRIMDYLRTCWNDEQLRKINNEFLNSYNYDNIENPPIQIVDDGYIAFYMGYHILNTKNINNKLKLFRLYLNLIFLGNKIRLTGQADVILDLEKYENYIVEGDETNRSFVNNIKTFLKSHGTDLYRYPNTDIVQSIIQYESEGLLYSKALDIARKNSSNNELYFDFVHERGVEEIKPSIIDVKENITAVCFLGDYVLVGTFSGVVKFFHNPTNKLKKELSGNGTSIKWVGACPAKLSQVAALTNDGYIKIWHVDDVEQEDSEEIIEEESDEVDNNNYPCNFTINPKVGPFLNCRWSNHLKSLITHTTNKIMMYKFDGTLEHIIDNFDNDEIMCCVPCNNDKFVIVAVARNGAYYLEIIDQNTNERIMMFEETDKVIDIMTVPRHNKILVLKSREITVCEYDFRNLRNKYRHQRSTQEVLLSAQAVKENLKFLALAVNKTGTLFFVSTDDSRIICCDLMTKSQFYLENRRGNVTSMAVSEIVFNDFEPGSDVLLTGTGTVETSAKVWNLEAYYVLHHTQRNSNVRLSKIFDVSFVNAVSPNTPSSINSSSKSINNSPRRHQSFANHTEAPKRTVTMSLSLERHSLKPLNLNGISNNNETTFQPLLAVVDDNHNIQVLRGKKMITEIITGSKDKITTIKISPCNYYVIYGFESGEIKKYTLRTKETQDIMHMYSPVQYLKFVTPQLLIAGSKDFCLMVYRLTTNGWKTDMLQHGKTRMGSQELLNDLQGVKRKPLNFDSLSIAGSDDSDDSKRVFSNASTMNRLRKNSGLVDCFWLKDSGMITIENNTAVKFWTQDMKLESVLNAKPQDITESVSCAAFQNNILVICSGSTPNFKTFELIHGDHLNLRLIQDKFAVELNSRITSCDLTSDGKIVAMGLESGDVVIWNVPLARQIRLLKHHKNVVQCCIFSPVPRSLGSSKGAASPSYNHSANIEDEDVPLVLITMASEIVWWNVTYMLNSRKSLLKTGRNALTPLPNLNDSYSKIDSAETTQDQNNLNTSCFFFGNGSFYSSCDWRSVWKGKTCKEGSKKKEILSCLKLSGLNAKKICWDEKFSCFVTVDNSGHIHIMNVMKSTKS